MLVNVIELRASNWGRNETDRTVGAGDSMNGRASATNWRVIIVVVITDAAIQRAIICMGHVEGIGRSGSSSLSGTVACPALTLSVSHFFSLGCQSARMSKN